MDQFVGPFRVLRLIGPNAVQVELKPPFDRKHNVFSVQLVKLHRASDPTKFPNRRQTRAPDPVVVNGEVERVVEKIVDERTIRQGSKVTREYKVRWEGLDATLDQWKTDDELANAKGVLREWRKIRRNEATKKKEDARKKLTDA